MRTPLLPISLDPLNSSSDSDSHEALAHRVWYLHVSLLVLLTYWWPSRIHVISRIAAGSSLPLLISSGVSSDDNDPIDGRYGYVAIEPYFEFP